MFYWNQEKVIEPYSQRQGYWKINCNIFEIAFLVDSFFNQNCEESKTWKWSQKLYSQSLTTFPKTLLSMGSIDIGRYLPGSVFSPDLYMGIKCAILRNLGNILWVSDLLIISKSKGDKRDLIVLIMCVEYVKMFELLIL